MNGLHTLFALGDPLELVIRGSAVYWFLFLLFRLILRRDIGAIGIADVLLVVLIADASQNAMAGEYTSITDGLVLVSTIAGWNYLLNWVSYRSTVVRRLLEPRPLLLISDGQVLRSHMRREMVTMDELLAKLREHGIEDPRDVKAARMESDGSISVIKLGSGEEAQAGQPPQRGATGAH